MRVDAGAYSSTVDGAAQGAVEAERRGYDGWAAFETQIDPLLACAVAAERTESITLSTAIAVAFARNPMTVAVQANDVQALSGGRFMLGLGSQIKPHITKRYSMPWSAPAARMREFVLAVRAIWRTWETDEPLAFEGEHYTHTLMTPFFNPGPNPHGNPKILLAAVGPLMTQTAGEVADGMLSHAFATEKYLREHTIPNLLKGREKAGKAGLDGFELTAPAMAAVGDTEEEIAGGIAIVKQQLGFYGSTPAYRPVLEAHGWGDLQTQLNEMTKRGEWDRIAGVIPDEVVETFAVIGTAEQAVDQMIERYGDVCTRIAIPINPAADPDRWRALFEKLRTA